MPTNTPTDHIATLRKHISRMSLDLSTLNVLSGNRADDANISSIDADILTILSHINRELIAISKVFKTIDDTKPDTAPTDQLPQEWRSQIELDAETFGEQRGERLYNIHQYFTNNDLKYGYEYRATTYALRAYKAEQENERLRKALKKIQALDWSLNCSWADKIATEALTSQTKDHE